MAILIILVAGFLMQQVAPWWSIVLIAGLVCFLFKLSIREAIIISLLSGFLLWGGYAYVLDSANNGVLSTQIGELFGGLSGFTLIFITGITGAVFGALGGVLGALAVKIRN